jgi:hypothetical protein
MKKQGIDPIFWLFVIAIAYLAAKAMGILP